MTTGQRYGECALEKPLEELTARRVQACRELRLAEGCEFRPEGCAGGVRRSPGPDIVILAQDQRAVG